MMTLMVDLIILVMFTSDSTSDVERTGTGGTSSGRRRKMKNFYASLSIRRFDEPKSRIHASLIRHSRVCIEDKRIHMITKDLEQRFRGSISLTADDCTVSIILVIFMIIMT